MQIRYNGVDIYQEVGVHSCFHDMYAEKQADEISIQFTDTGHVWDSWKPGGGDTIEVIHGHAKTGLLHVDSILPEFGGVTLRASSVPACAKTKNNKSWERVRFSQLIREIAGRWGMASDLYGLPDYVYTFATQTDQTDLEFLQQRCTLEGAAFLIYDNRLVVYLEREMETQTPTSTIQVTPEDTFQYEDRSSEAYGVVTVKGGELGSFTAPNGNRPLSVTLKVPVTTPEEAQRYARNVARAENKGLRSGTLYKDELLEVIAPGSAVMLETQTAQTWNGPAFITHLRHDYVNRTSKLEFRRPLEGY